MAIDLPSFKEDFFLLLESGFIAVNQADEDAAMKLFKAAEMLDPSNNMPVIGRGYLHLHKLELKEACRLFEDVLKKDPENQMVKTFLGLCMSFTPAALDKGEKLLNEMCHSDDNQIQGLSKTALDFVDRFIKKEPTPAEIKKNNKKKK